jgi:hypothetical protein
VPRVELQKKIAGSGRARGVSEGGLAAYGDRGGRRRAVGVRRRDGHQRFAFASLSLCVCVYGWSRKGERAFGSAPRDWGKNVTLLWRASPAQGWVRAWRSRAPRRRGRSSKNLPGGHLGADAGARTEMVVVISWTTSPLTRAGGLRRSSRMIGALRARLLAALHSRRGLHNPIELGVLEGQRDRAALYEGRTRASLIEA